MKIGQFAKENNVSIDTVRYYIDLGIIVPHKNGGHYEFDNSCKYNLNEILELKDIGFSLQEIKTFFHYKQFVKVENKVSNKYYKTFFYRKIKDTQKTIETLNRNIEILESKLAKFNTLEGHSQKESGIDLSSLNILCCPKCGGELTLHEGVVEDNQVMEGYLVCSCKEKYEIDDGILIIEKASNNKDDNLGMDFHMDGELLSEYINSTDSKFLDNLYKSLNWYDTNMKQEDFNRKIVLDLGVGVGFFLRLIYDKLTDNTIYIAVDYDINALNFIKNIIETSGKKKKIIYICADFGELPIKEQSIDMLIDYAGSTNYNFEHKDFLLDSMTKYLKDNSKLFGGYIMFDKFSKENILKQEFRNNYTLDNLKKRLNCLNFESLHEISSENIKCEKTSKYESYQRIGDVVFSYLCIRQYIRI